VTNPPVNYYPYTPPVPASTYGAGGGRRPPKRAKVIWLWVLIVVCIVVAVVRFAVAPQPSPAPPTITHAPTATTAPPTGTGTQTSTPSATSEKEVFCLNYYVFSIDVTSSWPAFGTAVAKRDAAGALTMMRQYQSEAQAIQQSDPPTAVKVKLDTVLSGFQTDQDVLATGSVSGLRDVNDIWADIAALQTTADAACR